MPRPYNRDEINKAFEKAKFILHEQALLRGNGRAYHLDTYTGEELWGGDRYDYDHIFPSEMIHTKYKDRLSDLEIAQVVNIPENIAVTLRSINQSKGKKDPEFWAMDTRIILSHPIKLELVHRAIARAKTALEAAASKYQ